MPRPVWHSSSPRYRSQLTWSERKSGQPLSEERRLRLKGAKVFFALTSLYLLLNSSWLLTVWRVPSDRELENCTLVPPGCTLVQVFAARGEKGWLDKG